MKWTLYILVLSICLVSARSGVTLHPKGSPPQGGWKPGAGITMGGGVAYLQGSRLEHAFAPSIELSLFKKIRGPFSAWVSAGGKLFVSNSTVGMPFVETGLNLLVVNVGMGYGAGMPDDAGVHHINLFLGGAIPLYTPKRGRLLYLQLYYRPIFTLPVADYPMAHEMGFLLKWLIAFHQ